MFQLKRLLVCLANKGRQNVTYGYESLSIINKKGEGLLSSLNNLEAPLSMLRKRKIFLAPEEDFLAVLRYLGIRLFISLHLLSLLKACPIPGTCVRGPKPLVEEKWKRSNPPRKHCNCIRWCRPRREQRYERLRFTARKWGGADWVTRWHLQDGEHSALTGNDWYKPYCLYYWITQSIMVT